MRQKEYIKKCLLLCRIIATSSLPHSEYKRTTPPAQRLLNGRGWCLCLHEGNCYH